MVLRHPEKYLRAGVYARIRFEDALDLPKQGHALAAFAEQKGWQVVLTELETGPESGRRLPARARLLEAVKQGELDVVVAWKLDRIARGLPELVSLLDLLHAHGAALATLADDFDFTAEVGPRLRHVVKVLSALQRTTHRDQVRSGVTQAKQLGNPMGRPPTSPERLREAQTLAEEGHSQREIARHLGLHPRTVARWLARIKDEELTPAESLPPARGHSHPPR